MLISFEIINIHHLKNKIAYVIRNSRIFIDTEKKTKRHLVFNLRILAEAYNKKFKS